jgi:hypothetical protein
MGAVERLDVVKLSSAGEQLWCTRLGGYGDQGKGIAVDVSGDVYVTGFTSTPGWTSGGHDTTYNGERDGFVAKLDSQGALLWSTYLGGTRLDGGIGIALAASEGVYVMGYTDSPDWTSGGFDTSYDGDRDAFVTKLSSSGAHVWSTYLGGSYPDWRGGIGVDTSGNVYVAGSDGLAKLTSTGEFLWSAYLGGAYCGIAVDTLGDIYVTGGHGFVAKLNSEGEDLWSTLLGGTDDTYAYGIVVDTSGDVYVAGETHSDGWTSGGADTSLNGDTDSFVVKLNSSGEHLWSTYVGYSGPDGAYGITVYKSESVYITGWSSKGVHLRSPSVAKLTAVPDTTPPSPNPSTWATEPYATGLTSICMVATTATDIMGVEYYFHETSGNPGATDSGWQDSSTYEDTGLLPGTTYTYQVKTRDKSIGQNETSYSTEGSATTEADTTPPSPDPSTWVTAPYSTGSTSVRMAATTASDLSGVEYYFHETTGNPGATDSGWQDSNTYEDTGLSAGMTYTYQVKTRDKSAAQNETGYSSLAAATTPSPVFRFWSNTFRGHFYTISTEERDYVMARWPQDWTYEGVAFYAYAAGQQPSGATPVYRFWSATFLGHFYTASQSERDSVIANYSRDWAYEDIAYYVFAAGQQPTGTLPVYRFWSSSFRHHFYTISSAERQKLLNDPARLWEDEGSVWYTYGA